MMPYVPKPFVDFSPRKVVRWKAGERIDIENVVPTQFGPERAEEIMAAATEATTCGPVTDNMPKVMSDGEIAYVHSVWDTMPGNTCWWDAFCRIRKNEDSGLVSGLERK